MTPQYLFDTSVCIDALRLPVGRVPEGLDRFWNSDIAISAITLADLITSNLKEFKRVPGLTCQNWDR